MRYKSVYNIIRSSRDNCISYLNARLSLQLLSTYQVSVSRGELGTFCGQWSPLFLDLTHGGFLFSHQIITGTLYLHKMEQPATLFMTYKQKAFERGILFRLCDFTSIQVLRLQWNCVCVPSFRSERKWFVNNVNYSQAVTNGCFFCKANSYSCPRRSF